MRWMYPASLALIAALLTAASAGDTLPAPPGTLPAPPSTLPLTKPAPKPLAARLIITDADPKAPAPVQLSTLDLHVAVAGPLAQTAATLTFENTTNRVLEGEFEFPLPENAAVTGYGLDVNGVMVDGVPVEKQRARQIFESEVRRGVDPGILEQSRGNNFKTRIYPIPAKGKRTVKVVFVSELARKAGIATFSLPLTFADPIKQANVQIAVRGYEKAPTVAGLESLKFRATPIAVPIDPQLRTRIVPEKEPRPPFEVVATQFEAQQSFHDIQLSGALTITVPTGEGPMVLVETFKKPVAPEVLAGPPARPVGVPDAYFLASLPAWVPPPKPPRAVAKPARVLIYWDASFSREKADKSAELEFIKNLAADFDKALVDVATFRNAVDPPVTFEIAKGDATALLKHLESITYDGGTDLSALLFHKNRVTIFDHGVVDVPSVAYAYAVLVTDGLSTLGGPPQKPELPVYTVTADARADFAALRAIAASSPGGLFLNLQKTPPKDAAQTLAAGGGYRLISISADEKQAGEIFPRGARPNEPLIVSGKLLTDEATVTLNYGYGNDILERKPITLKRAGAGDSGLVARYWAQQKIAELSADPEKNADALLALGREFNMVTPNTSLMVLETVEQYLRHRIVPPTTLTQIYKEFAARIEQEGAEKKKVEEAKITRVLAMWEARKKWWEQDFSKVVVTTMPEGTNKTDRVTDMLPAMVSPGTVNSGAASQATRGIGREVEHAIGGGGVVVVGGQPAGAASGPAAREPNRPVREYYRALGDVAGRSDALKEKVAENTATLHITPWDPKSPYIDAIEKAGPAKAYAVFLEQRKTFGAAPAFYLDCAEWFRKKDQRELTVRILTDLAELKLESAPLLRIAAYRLMQIDQHDLAIDLFQKARALRPDEPQSWRDLALAHAARGRLVLKNARLPWDKKAAHSDFIEAVRLLHHVVMTNWDRFPEIEVIALMEANEILRSTEYFPNRLLNPFDSRLVKNLDCDLRIVLTWDADATDIDLHVVEPTGETCLYSHNRTQIGGLLSKDFTDGYGPEEYCIKSARPGTYAIKANYYGSHQAALTGPVTVQATVITNFGRPTETRESLTLRLTEAKEFVDIGTAKIAPAK